MSTTERLAEALAAANRIVAFTGAGISTESGIPDFRGPQGLWTKIDPSEFTIQNYMANPEHRRRVWRMRIERGEQRFEPNAGHRAIAELERIAKLDCVVTQNVDGLHQDAGNTTVLELHGSPREVLCTGCRGRWPADEVLARVRRGEEDPSCEMCGGILKSATISFGEALPVGVLEEAYRRAEACDMCLVVGSSLVVYPAADVPMQAVRIGARLAIVNAEPTPMDSFADPVVIGPAGDVLSRALESVQRTRT
jgi:NAD-dependent protein deacetylase/lipoamidase